MCSVYPTRTGGGSSVCVWGGGGGGVSEARGSTKRVLKTERVMFRYPIYLTFPKIYLRKCL